ncbi:hypothetical protein [Nitrososphaera sp.]|uniref:hypothetical protein n=1 Tax=Nitrososphaera sp. TaxID=1971748 RepID=UPI002EDA099F
MPDLKVEVLLPLYYNPDSKRKRIKIEGSKYSKTYDDISNKFGGCTMDNSPLVGGWLDPKTKKPVKDISKTYWVICKKTKTNIQFFKKLKKNLEARFMQEEIMMYYIQVHRF